MSKTSKLMMDQRAKMEKYPATYHDLHAIQLLQHINGYLVNYDISTNYGQEIQDLYERITSNLYKNDKPILLSGTARKAVIAHCINYVCLTHNIKSDKFKIASHQGLTKKRMKEIEKKYCLDKFV